MEHTAGRDARHRTSAARSSDVSGTVKTLPPTQFGTGKAEVYLVDTLNELAKYSPGMSRKASAKCMDVISSARHETTQLYKLKLCNVVPLQTVLHLMRLVAKEHGEHNATWNASLDEELAAWNGLMTAESYTAMSLEHRAYKLAMNIARSSIKRLIAHSANQRKVEMKKQKAVQKLMSKGSVNG